MSFVCGGLDFKDAASPSSGPNKCSNNAPNHVSVIGSEDAQEAEGDGSSGNNIHQYLKEESKDVVPEPLPLKSCCDDEGEVKKNPAQVLFSESVSAATVIIPAIKGSREKHGKSLEKMTRVSWAEDVYDPPPSIVSHTRSKKHHHHQKSKSRDSLKKNGKKGHKGSSSSSSRGSSKDKKSSSSSSRSKHSRDKFGWATQPMPIAAASS